jgi:hypothetical protein
MRTDASGVAAASADRSQKKQVWSSLLCIHIYKTYKTASKLSSADTHLAIVHVDCMKIHQHDKELRTAHNQHLMGSL